MRFPALCFILPCWCFDYSRILTSQIPDLFRLFSHVVRIKIVWDIVFCPSFLSYFLNFFYHKKINALKDSISTKSNFLDLKFNPINWICISICLDFNRSEISVHPKTSFGQEFILLALA